MQLERPPQHQTVHAATAARGRSLALAADALAAPPLPLAAPAHAGAMALMNYFRNVIQRNMEDPAERDSTWEKHLRSVQAAAASA